MANIAISELQTTADTLENEDLILVSKNDGSSFTSAKMKGSVLKSQVGGCQASAALTSYGSAKTSDVTSAKTAIQTSISSLNNLSSSQVQSACESAITSKSVSTLTAAQIKTQVESALTSKNISTLTEAQVKTQVESVSSRWLDYENGQYIKVTRTDPSAEEGQQSIAEFTVPSDGEVRMYAAASGDIYVLKINNFRIKYNGYEHFYVKKNDSVYITRSYGSIGDALADFFPYRN